MVSHGFITLVNTEYWVTSYWDTRNPKNAIAAHADKEDKTSTLFQGSGSNYMSFPKKVDSFFYF